MNVDPHRMDAAHVHEQPASDPAAGYHIQSEIRTQSVCWAEAGRRLDAVEPRLPKPGERVLAVGCGTSLYIAQAYSALREASGQGETDAYPASEVPSGRRYDCVLALSRSGTTTELLTVLSSLSGSPRRVAITASRSSPLASVADSIVLEFADEQSVVQTRFATTTLALLRCHLGMDMALQVQAAEQAQQAELPGHSTDKRRYTFLGRGWTVGLANEAALKIHETSGSWAEAYPAMEYRHGPISLADSQSLVWMLGDFPDGLEDEIKATGAQVVVSEIDPLAELIRVQRTAVLLAISKGLNPDAPPHLARSVILDV